MNELKISAKHGKVSIVFGDQEVVVPRDLLIKSLSEIGHAIVNSGDISEPTYHFVSELLEQASKTK